MKFHLLSSVLALSVLAACSSGSDSKGGGGGEIPTSIDVTIPQGKVLSDEATAALKAKFSKGEANFELEKWIYKDEKKPDREQSANEKKWVSVIQADCSIAQKEEKSTGEDEELHVGQQIIQTSAKSITGESCPLADSDTSRTTITFESVDSEAKSISGKIETASEKLVISKNEELANVAGSQGMRVGIAGQGQFKVDESQTTTHLNFTGEVKIIFEKDELAFALNGEGLSIESHQDQAADKNSMILNMTTQILGEEVKVTVRTIKQDGSKTTEYFINGYSKTEAEMKEIFGHFNFDPLNSDGK